MYKKLDKLSNNSININISYLTNFKPTSFLYFSNIKLFKNKNNNKIVSRNFFLFLVLIKYMKTSSYNLNYLNTSIFIKPHYKKFITLLRAPYRHKLSRHQFMFSRYYVLLTIKNNVKHLYTDNVNNLIIYIHFIKRFYV